MILLVYFYTNFHYICSKIITIMYYDLVGELIGFVKQYEEETGQKRQDVHLFVQWMNQHLNHSNELTFEEPEWIGKENGRSPESVINTSLVHLYRYAKLLAKEAIAGSSFSTPDDFIYLISLVSHGSMTKTALIKLNVHEKSAGIQIINRLIHAGLVEQSTTEMDKRNRMIRITEEGTAKLTERLQHIKQASASVTAPLSHQEKMDLIRLLAKLEDFHAARMK